MERLRRRVSCFLSDSEADMKGFAAVIHLLKAVQMKPIINPIGFCQADRQSSGRQRRR